MCFYIYSIGMCIGECSVQCSVQYPRVRSVVKCFSSLIIRYRTEFTAVEPYESKNGERQFHNGFSDFLNENLLPYVRLTTDNTCTT